MPNKECFDVEASGAVLRAKVEAALAMIIVDVYQGRRLECSPSAKRIFDIILDHSEDFVEGPMGSFLGVIEAAAGLTKRSAALSRLQRLGQEYDNSD